MTSIESYNSLSDQSPSFLRPKQVFCTQKPSVATSLVDVTEMLSSHVTLPCRVLFKNELEQPSGSFKLRGIGNLIQKSIISAAQKGSTNIHVFASSGGNAGLAAAYASQKYNVRCTVVVPTSAKLHIVQQLEKFGAQVVLRGQTISEADQHARRMMSQCSSNVHTIYCHPFDNPLIWEGHSQIVDEVFSQLPEADFSKVRGFVCSVGGGGLYNGIATGLKRNKSRADCLLVETKQAPTLNKAVAAGSVVTLDSVNSLATSLACSYVSPSTLKLFQDQSEIKSHLRAIDDLDAVRGTLAYYNDFGRIVEPACGAALSVVYNQLPYLERSIPDLKKDDIIVVVICGGSCTTEQTLDQYRSLLRSSHL